MQASDLRQKITSWRSSGPADGEVMFYAVNSNGNISNTQSSANGYGHWFSSNGNRSDYSSGYLFSEFYPTMMTFILGQYPGRLTNGKDYTISQAFKYKLGEKTAVVTFVFNVHITSDRSGAVLAGVRQADVVTGVEAVTDAEDGNGGDAAIYDLSGRKLSGASDMKKGVYIVNGKKIIR
jgi:hypothetical protein